VRLAAALAVSCLLLAACGANGPLSVADASRSPSGTAVDVKGTLVIEFGKPMLCSGLADEDEGTRCGSPALWIEGPVASEHSDAEPVTLHGTVNEGVLTLTG
jgi:predicted small lipoprotein YifL